MKTPEQLKGTIRSMAAKKNLRAQEVLQMFLFERILERMANSRFKDNVTKKTVYKKQTADAEICGKSNCPLCAVGNDNNARRIYKQTEMDADHVTAWSNGGATDISNCTMLCKTHNRAKGNK